MIRYYLLFLMMIMSSTVFAQTYGNKNFINKGESMMDDGSIWSKPPSAELKGSQFLFDRFTIGDVYYNTNTSLDSAWLNIDSKEGNLLVSLNVGVQNIPLTNVDSVTIEGDVYIFPSFVKRVNEDFPADLTINRLLASTGEHLLVENHYCSEQFEERNNGGIMERYHKIIPHTEVYIVTTSEIQKLPKSKKKREKFFMENYSMSKSAMKRYDMKDPEGLAMAFERVYASN